MLAGIEEWNDISRDISDSVSQPASQQRDDDVRRGRLDIRLDTLDFIVMVLDVVPTLGSIPVCSQDVSESRHVMDAGRTIYSTFERGFTR